MSIISAFLNEQIVVFCLAVLLFALLRRWLRPRLMSMRQFWVDPSAKDSLLGTMLIAYVSCFVIVMGKALLIVLDGGLSGNRKFGGFVFRSELRQDGSLS